MWLLMTLEWQLWRQLGACMRCCNDQDFLWQGKGACRAPVLDKTWIPRGWLMACYVVQEQLPVRPTLKLPAFKAPQRPAPLLASGQTNQPRGPSSVKLPAFQPPAAPYRALKASDAPGQPATAAQGRPAGGAPAAAAEGPVGEARAKLPSLASLLLQPRPAAVSPDADTDLPGSPPMGDGMQEEQGMREYQSACSG